jgi:cytidylate kinase
MTGEGGSLVIAIDGPAAAGKGTLGRRLARELDLAHLDTGALYRAVGAKLLSAGRDPHDPEAAEAAARSLRMQDLERPGLRDEAVGEAASVVAAQPPVRQALLEFQRRFAQDPPEGKRGAVLDGRDIGTVVCPDAQLKLFVTASAEERARRRHEELLARGEASIYARVLEDMKARDARDEQRAAAPLKPAEGAYVLDTSDLDADAAFAAAWAFVVSEVGNGRRRGEDGTDR